MQVSIFLRPERCFEYNSSLMLRIFKDIEDNNQKMSRILYCHVLKPQADSQERGTALFGLPQWQRFLVAGTAVATTLPVATPCHLHREAATQPLSSSWGHCTRGQQDMGTPHLGAQCKHTQIAVKRIPTKSIRKYLKNPTTFKRDDEFWGSLCYQYDRSR